MEEPADVETEAESKHVVGKGIKERRRRSWKCRKKQIVTTKFAKREGSW